MKDDSLKIQLTIKQWFQLQKTSCKMASSLCQKHSLCQKAQNFEHFSQYDLVQIWPACCPSTYQIMYGGILDF